MNFTSDPNLWVIMRAGLRARPAGRHVPDRRRPPQVEDRYHDEVERREAIEREHDDRERDWAEREKEWRERDSLRAAAIKDRPTTPTDERDRC